MQPLSWTICKACRLWPMAIPHFIIICHLTHYTSATLISFHFLKFLRPFSYSVLLHLIIPLPQYLFQISTLFLSWSQLSCHSLRSLTILTPQGGVFLHPHPLFSNPSPFYFFVSLFICLLNYFLFSPTKL